MTPDRLFTLCGNFVLPCWLLLILLPRWRWTQRITTFAAPILLAALYAWLLIAHKPPPGAGFNSLTQVAALFSVKTALLAGWIHYLAFDLFTGSWELRDAQLLRISHWVVIPCLILTFLFGPVGLTLYLILRAAMRRRFGASDPILIASPTPELS